MHNIKTDGLRCWQAEGRIDGELMRVPLYPEHKRAIEQSGYKLTWGKPDIVITNAEGIDVALTETNGRRRIAAVMKYDDNGWIEIEQR